MPIIGIESFRKPTFSPEIETLIAGFVPYDEAKSNFETVVETVFTPTPNAHQAGIDSLEICPSEN